MTLPTRWKLASALVAAGLYDMADKAVVGFYDDFLSPVDLPISMLVFDLREVGTPEALLIAEDAKNGLYDATEAEADSWVNSPDGRETFANFLKANK
jgi:hypothetical protein